MVITKRLNDPRLIDCLQTGGVAVVRTDTLYGIVAKANDSAAVERIFQLKQRSPDKPVLVLIDNVSQLFDAYDTKPFMNTYWPGKHTIILPAPSAPAAVTRGSGTVAYRLPDNDALRELIRTVGPLVAPSANPEGQTPAATIEQAVEYFGDAVDTYIDGGAVTDLTPSQLLRPLSDGTMERLR